MADESYDPHARMHPSFPRVDSGSSGSFDERFNQAREAIDNMSIDQNPELTGKLIDTGIFKRHQGSFPPAKNPNHYK